MTVYIFSDLKSTRLSYVLDYIFVDIFGLSYVLFSDKSDFNTINEGIKISYGKKLENCFSIPSVNLLFQDDIKPQNLRFSNDFGLKKLFSINEDFNLNFDLFAAVFYLLSRYEEYLPFTADEHGRFSANSSCAHKFDFISIPIVDIWIKDLGEKLKNKYPLLILKEQKFTVYPSFDIDQAFAFKYRGIKKNTLGWINDLLHLRFDLVKLRTKVVLGLSEDPFDTYDMLDSMLSKYGHQSRALFFFLMNYKRPFDLAHDSQNIHFTQLVQKLADTYQIGIHPSYESFINKTKILEEQLTLKRIVGKTISDNRFHFLKLRLPDSYRILIELGIQNDYTMGFADKIGFRAGTSRPFLWFNLSANRQTSLKIKPFSIMDVSLKNYNRLNLEEANEKVNLMINQLKTVDGDLRFIWHNSSFATSHGWYGWHELLTKLLKL